MLLPPSNASVSVVVGAISEKTRSESWRRLHRWPEGGDRGGSIHPATSFCSSGADGGATSLPSRIQTSDSVAPPELSPTSGNTNDRSR